MRTIEFRGRRIDTREWVYGQLLVAVDEHLENHSVITTDVGFCWGYYVGINARYEVIPSTVGQFTGLLDKNGKKIYEGDITNEGVIAFGKIGYDCNWNGMTGFYLEDEDNMFMNLYWSFDPEELEIIGDIYEKEEQK